MHTALRELVFAYWFFLPAGLANAAPPIANVIPGLKRFETPMDFGRSWRGKRLLGPHKRWRGLIAGMVVSTLILAAQIYAYTTWHWVRYPSGTVDYATLPLWLLGPLFGLGALGGDAVESFFKRRYARESGTAWVPFDQIDYVIGGLLLSALVVPLRPIDYVTILGLYFVLHFGGSYLGYLLKLKDKPL